MAYVFISYCRESQDIVEALAQDIVGLGHKVWLDRELAGGQAWWDQILGVIRECDVFLFALAPESLDSSACKREYQICCRSRQARAACLNRRGCIH